jgi:hypothetical protein
MALSASSLAQSSGYWMAFGVFFFGVFTYLSITQSLFMGSEYFMQM